MGNDGFHNRAVQSSGEQAYEACPAPHVRKQFLDKYQGCLVGGAAGDALGYPVEFFSHVLIEDRFGDGGIRAYDHDFFRGGKAQFSDDTQMTLFTAEGILNGAAAYRAHGEADEPDAYIYRAYLDWLKTQNARFAGDAADSGLLKVRELYRRMAPGVTCLSALESGIAGAPERPINDSKGCGGVMRVAPVGLYFGHDLDYCVECAARAAALTHGHPLGYISAGALAYIVARCVVVGGSSDDASHLDYRAALERIVLDCCEGLPVWFPDHPRHVSKQVELLQLAVDLARSGKSDVSCIVKLGRGWVGEEALAIAVYASMRYPNDFSTAIIAAVNHDGDSDSTGAICGNIMGALLGLSAIDDEWVDGLEMADLVLNVAACLCNDHGI